MITHGYPLARELVRLTALLGLAVASITVALPFLLGLAAAAAR